MIQIRVRLGTKVRQHDAQRRLKIRGEKDEKKHTEQTQLGIENSINA